MVTDPIADLITQLKNAGMARKESVNIPFSQFKLSVAEKLKEAGYVKTVEKRGKKVRKAIEIDLLYDKSGAPKIQNVQRISTPGRRMYRSAQEMHPVRFGRGALILSTPQGVMTGTEAKNAGVGGEALFEIW